MSEERHFEADNQLIRSLAIGDRASFRQVYLDGFPMVKRMVLAMQGTEADAYDIFQDCMSIIYLKAKDENLILKCKLTTFITSIAKRLWLKKLRTEKRQFQDHASYIYNADDRMVDSMVDLADYEVKEIQFSYLKEALLALGNPCADILKEFYIKDKSMKEIATLFNYTNPSNAKNQKHKCLKRLKKIYFELKNE